MEKSRKKLNIYLTAFAILLMPLSMTSFISKAQAEEAPTYLMAASRASLNGWSSGGPYTEEPSTKYGMYLLSSTDTTDDDNQEFNYISPRPILSESGPGDAQTRDAAILWQDSAFWVMWPHSPIDGNHFDFRSSTDLINWTEQSPFTLEGATATGGGSWYVDGAGLVHALLPFSTDGDVTSAIIYESHPNNPANLTGTWSEPVALTYTDPESEDPDPQDMAGYDPTIFHCGSNYYLTRAPFLGWYVSAGDIISDWVPYGGDNNGEGNDTLNTANVTMPEGFSAMPTDTGWRIYADNKAGLDYAKTAYVDLTTSGNSFTSEELELTDIDVNPFGPSVIELTAEAAAIVQSATEYYANSNNNQTVDDLSYTTSTVEGITKPLNSDYNYPNRIYNLADPGADTTWEMVFQLPSSYEDSHSTNYIPPPANPIASIYVGSEGGYTGTNSYRIYAYKNSGDTIIVSYSYTSVQVTSLVDNSVDVSWDAVSGADGYIVTASNDQLTNPYYYYYKDITSGTSFVDADSSGWMAGSSEKINSPDIIPAIPTGWQWNVTVNLPATSFNATLAVKTVDRYYNYSTLTTLNAGCQTKTGNLEIQWDGTNYNLTSRTINNTGTCGGSSYSPKQIPTPTSAPEPTPESTPVPEDTSILEEDDNGIQAVASERVIDYVVMTNDDGSNVETPLGGEEIAQFNNPRPLIKGQTVPNASVEFKIESPKVIIATVQSDNMGYWQYQLEEDLDLGVHKVTITVIKDYEILQSKTYNFEIISSAKAQTSPTPISTKDKSDKTNSSEKSSTSIWWYLIPLFAVVGIVVIFFIIKRKRS